jgi:hypothetical protein
MKKWFSEASADYRTISRILSLTKRGDCTKKNTYFSVTLGVFRWPFFMAFLFTRFQASPCQGKPIRPPLFREISRDTKESEERRRGPK